MAFVSWDEVGANSAQLIGRLGHAVRRGVCQFRQSNPFLFDPISTALPGTPLAAINRGFWDEVCSLDPLPGTYPDNVTGGRCATAYRWFVDWSSPSGTGTRQDPFNASYMGPISNPRITYTRINSNTQVRMDFSFTTGGGTNQTFFVINGDVNAMPFARAVRFVRVDGQADNCGTVPVTRNVLRPVSNTFNTTLNIGGTAVNLPITLGDISVSADNVVGFNPVFDTQIGPFVLDLDGISIDLVPDVPIGDDSGGGSVDLQPVIDEVTQTRIQLSTEISEVLSDLEALDGQVEQGFSDLESLIRCFCGEEDATVTAEVIANGTTGGVFALPEGTLFCVIEGTGFDALRLRTMDGNGSSGTVWFWGWYSVGYGPANGGHRLNLQYTSHAVPVGEGASAINVTCYTGTTATITAYVKELNCNVNGALR